MCSSDLHRLVRIFESLPIVGSLIVGVWIPAALGLIVLNELSLLASSVSEPIGGAVVAVLFVAGTVTILFGGLSALLHDDIGEVLGFLAVGNAGWLTLGAAAIIVHPSAVGPLLIAVPGALVISLFGLWRISIRRHYDIASLQELRGWARRTQAIAVVLVCAGVAQSAVPAREFLSGRFDIEGVVGGALVGAGALLGAVAIAAAVLRLLLVGVAQESRAVHRSSEVRLVSPAAIWLMSASGRSAMSAGLLGACRVTRSAGCSGVQPSGAFRRPRCAASASAPWGGTSSVHPQIGLDLSAFGVPEIGRAHV